MRTFFIAVALTAFAAPAFAGAAFTAAPTQSVVKTGFEAGAVIWDCDASGCRSTSDTSASDSMSVCRGLAHEVGALSAFALGPEAFSAERLARCNVSAPKPKT